MSVFTIEEGRHNNTYLRFKAHADPCQDNVDVRTRPPGSHYTASSTNISCFYELSLSSKSNYRKACLNIR